MKHIFILTLFCCLVANVSCQNKKRTEQKISQEEQADMETKYQQIWETALSNQDFSIIEELIAKKRRFKLSFFGHGYNIRTDTINNSLVSILYWSLDKNVEYGRSLSGLSYRMKEINDRIMFWDNRVDEMDTKQIYNIDFATYPSEKTKDTIEVKKILEAYQIELDTIQKEIYKVKKQGEANLKLIQFALDRGCKLNGSVASSMVFGKSGESQWDGNEISLVYYFDQIAPNPQYLEPNITYPPELTSTLAQFLPSMSISSSTIKYLYSKGIDKKQFFDIVYPTLEEDDELGMESCLPTYENEKILIELMPEDMQKYRGRTPLHAAIDAICVADVKELVRKDRNLLNIKTVPKRGFYDYQDDKLQPLTPLEIARFKQKQIEGYLREYSSKENPDFTYIIMLEQINKIVSFLEKETGVSSKKEKWTTLID